MKTLIIAVLLIASASFQNLSAGNTYVNSFQDVINEYLNLKNELAADNSSGAKTSASGLLNALNNLQTDNITESESKIWKKYSKKMIKNAENISGSGEIEYQRENFKSLSAYLFKVLKAFNNNSSELYYQFCPMADNDKGAYWISENPKIVNPYMGKKMLHCGSTEEVVKVK